MMKYFLFFIIFNSYNLYSQTDEDLYKFYFEIAKDFHTSSTEIVKSVHYDPKSVFIKSKYSIDTLKNCIEYFENNAVLSMKNKEDQIEIKLESNFPTYYQEDLFNIVKLGIVNSNLFDDKNLKVELSNSNSNSMGGKMKDNSYSEMEYRSIENKTFALTKNINLKGDLNYKLSFLTNYSMVKLTKDSIGKIIELNKLKYKIVDIIKNKLVLKKLYSDIYNGDIKILIFDKNKKLILPDDGNQSRNSLFWTAKMDEVFYNFISKKDFSSYDNFKKILKHENLLPVNPEYIIIVGLSNLENEFILDDSEYNAQKSFNINVLKK